MMTTRQQSGFGLVELMISLTLGLLLSAAILQAFLATRSSYRVQEAISEIQVTSRYATHFLGKDIRMAGYMGCASIDGVSPNVIANNIPADVVADPAQAVRGQNNVPAGNALNAVEGTDTLTVRRASARSAQLTGNMSATNANVQIETGKVNLVAQDLVYITDCETTDLFRATAVSKGASKTTIVHANSGNATNRLSKAFGPDAEILAFESANYFVGDTGRTTSDGAPIRALFVQKRALGQAGVLPDPAELVAGVENMQITYGEDTNGDNNIDTYVDADNVVNWARVRSVKIELLVVSNEENVVTQGNADTAQRITFQGQPVVNNDGRYRRSFISVFAIRNRVP